MRKHLTFLLALIICTSAAASGLRGVNSGIIPYACQSNGAHFLLAYDPVARRRGWGAFGGTPEGNELASDTAKREFREETNCVYSQGIIDKIELEGPSNSRGFYSFLAEVPYVETTEIEKSQQCDNVERSLWIWVPHDALIAALHTEDKKPAVSIKGPPEKEFYLWSGAAESLRKARSDGLFAGITCPS